MICNQSKAMLNLATVAHEVQMKQLDKGLKRHQIKRRLQIVSIVRVFGRFFGIRIGQKVLYVSIKAFQMQLIVIWKPPSGWQKKY